MELVLTQLKKSFGDKVVLKDATFTFERGKIYGLLGRNGAGKTTLFNCLAGDLEYDGGTAQLRDGKPRPLNPADIGYVFATPILPEFLTGYEFLKFIADVHPGKADRSIEAYFDLVKIGPEDQRRLIKDYSHGMKNKLQMLCQIIARPPVILLDEPLTSFDVVVAFEMKKLLLDLKEEHILIFSTHILQLATDMCDEIVILHGGELEGVAPEVFHSEAFEQRVFDILKDEGGE